MPYRTIIFEVADGVATITLNRPAQRNAFGDGMGDELSDAYRRCDADPAVRAVVLTGTPPAFCAGADLSEGGDTFRKRDDATFSASGLGTRAWDVRKPVIAAVNGHAHGLGLGIALACDIIYAAESASLSMAFSRIGLAPDGCTSYFLTRAVGLVTAKELMFTGRRLSAEEARQLGLLNFVVPDDELMETATATARKLADGATIGICAAKRALNESALHTIEEQAEIEAFGQAIAMTSEDHREGIAAFAEKRTPKFKGR
jgi:enoyl-CoA hydratase/carnithine racemase